MDTATYKKVVRVIFEQAWNRQQYDDVNPYLAEQMTLHFRGAPIQTGRDDLPGLVARWKQAFPDLHFDIVALVGDGDTVAANLLMSGTQAGPWKGIESRGNRFQVEEMMFFRFAGGKIVEMWEVYDELAMRQQLTA